MSVNVPTNTRIKEQDVNQKLQLYGIFSAFSNGKVPSNKQIDIAMNSALASRGLNTPSKKLSPEGQKLVGDLRTVIEQAKVLLLTKNDGNLLQDFIWQTQQIGGGNASKPSAPLDKGTAKQHGNQALDGLRTLGTLLISNGQFRKLLSDATILLRDMAGDAAQKAANKVNPSEDELNQLDKPADDNTWHENPNMSRGHLKDQARSKFNEQKPFNRDQLKGAVGDATQSAHPSGSRNPADAADLAARDQQHGTNSGMDARQGARDGINNLRQQASQNVPDETKDRARETRDRTRGYLENKIPQERRDQTIWRLKKMVAEIQGHQDYQQAIDTLLSLAEEYTGHTKNLAGQTQGTVKGAHSDDSLQMAESDLKTLIERFANNTSLDDLFDSINTIYRDADHDPELKGFFRNMNKYIRRCLKEQGYVLQDSSTDEWNKLYEHGNFLLRDRYRNHTDRIADELKFYADQFDKDTQNKQFAESMQKLFTELGNDENGKPTFKPHLVKDLTDVIIPGIFETIRYVPIPRIEYSDHMMDAIVENLVLEGDNLAPNVMEFGSDNYWRWGRKSVSSRNKNKVMLSISGIQCDLRDVSYYVKKKEGFPAVTDKGVMDIFLGGSGLSFKVAMETADKSDGMHFFKVNTVDVDMKNLQIKMKQSNHKLLFNLFKPLLLKVMKPVITKVVEKLVKDKIHQLDGMLYGIQQEVDRAKADAMKNPENAQNIYQRYATAAQNKFMKGKQKKDEVAADKKVNMAVTQNDSIFKNISLPGGISTKATEYQDLARKGDKWESPIFSIGSARESSNLPKVAGITRKSHHVNTEGVRGPQNVGREGHGQSGREGYGQTGREGYGQSDRDAYDQEGYGQTGRSGAYDQSTTGGYGSTGAPGYESSNAGYGSTGAPGYESSSAGYGSTGAPGYESSSAGYGSTGAPGYESSNAGYGNPASSGYGNTGVVGSGAPYDSNATSGFGNEVSQAFDGSRTANSNPIPIEGDGNTLLGVNNPVLQGRV